MSDDTLKNLLQGARLRQRGPAPRMSDSEVIAMVEEVQHDSRLSVLDSLPVPVCRFARAHRCRLFPGVASYGKDATIPGTMFGLSAHLEVAWPGVITAFDLAPANASDISVAPLLL